MKCLVEQATKVELAWLEEKLTYSQGGMYGGKVCYLKTTKKAGAGVYFGAGLIRTVLREAKKDGLFIQVDDTRRRPCEPGSPDFIPTAEKTPHYYQREASDAFTRFETGVVELPTGSGKTLVTAQQFQRFRHARVIFLVSDAVLVKSTAATVLDATGLTLSRSLAAQHVATTLQSVYAALRKNPRATKKLLALFDVVIVDEAHQVPAATFEKVCSAITAYWRFALSATPFSRSDKKSAPLLALFGGTIYRKTEVELAAEGYLPKAIIRMVVHQQAEFFLGKYPAAYTAQIVKSQARNDLIAQCVSLALKPCLVLFTDIKHGHGPALRLRILSEGFTAELVDARASTARRTKVLADLNARRLDVVVASSVFNVGVDVPEVRSIVIAGGGAAVIRTIQRLGRGMRRTKTKKFFQLWDILDYSEGFRKGRGTWIAKHANARFLTYRRRGHVVFTSNNATGPWTRNEPLNSSSRKGKVQVLSENTE